MTDQATAARGPAAAPAALPTPSQTIGPFFSHALPWPDGEEVVAADRPGAIRIEGRVTDGAGDPVPDAMIETWQADPDGRFAHPEDPSGGAGVSFRGFGRSLTDADGRYRIVTLKPGPIPGPGPGPDGAPGGGPQAPHIDVSVFARGLLHRLVTRIYFPDEAERNAADPVLASIEDPGRRATLVAVADADADADGKVLRFDIRLQGEHETVFFAI